MERIRPLSLTEASKVRPSRLKGCVRVYGDTYGGNVQAKEGIPVKKVGTILVRRGRERGMREQNVYEALKPGELWDGKEKYSVYPGDPDNPDSHGTRFIR